MTPMSPHETTASRIGLLVATVVFGLFFIAFGVAGVALEYRTPPVHFLHIGVFIGLILLGAILLPGIGSVIFARLKDGVTLAGPYLPAFGRRVSAGEIDLSKTDHPVVVAPPNGAPTEPDAEAIPGVPHVLEPEKGP